MVGMGIAGADYSSFKTGGFSGHPQAGGEDQGGEGLKVPKKQPKRGRLWLNDGSCFRRRPTHRSHVWSYDFVSDRTHDGRAIKMLTVIDELCLAIFNERSLKSDDVLECFAKLFIRNGARQYIRSDNGSELTARVILQWLKRLGVRTLFIEPGSPWENGCNESFNGQLRDEFLSGELFFTLKEAKVLIEKWRLEHNMFRPHSSLNYRPPAPEAYLH